MVTRKNKLAKFAKVICGLALGLSLWTSNVSTAHYFEQNSNRQIAALNKAADGSGGITQPPGSG
jgi:hypothetical protein